MRRFPLIGSSIAAIAVLSRPRWPSCAVEQLGLQVGQRQQLIAELTSVEAQLDAPQPKRTLISECFSSGRNILEGPGFASVDVSVIKNTTIREHTTLQFRAEFFNLLDRANFDLPDNFLGSPTFGRILSAESPRRVQFGLKLLF